MSRGPANIAPTALLFVVLSLCGAVFLALVGIDALEGRNNFQFFADSGTYYEMARGDLLRVDGFADAVSVGTNFLGPMLILKVVGENYYAVMVVNTLMMFLATVSIARTVGIDTWKYSLLLLADPLTFSSILSVNKEVLSVVFLAMLLRATHRRSSSMWLGAGLISILVRWQLTLFTFVLMGVRSSGNLLRRRRLLTVLLLLAAMSAIYLELADLIESVRSNFEVAAEEYQGSGLYEWLVALQEKGLYWLVFPLKAAHLLFGAGLRFDRLFNPVDYYNDGWQLLHSTVLLGLFCLLVYKRRFRLRDDLIYLSILYIVVFAISPIYSPRYFYPVYVLWAAAYLRPRRRPQPAFPADREIELLQSTPLLH